MVVTLGTLWTYIPNFYLKIATIWKWVRDIIIQTKLKTYSHTGSKLKQFCHFLYIMNASFLLIVKCFSPRAQFQPI